MTPRKLTRPKPATRSCSTMLRHRPSQSRLRAVRTQISFSRQIWIGWTIFSRRIEIDTASRRTLLGNTLVLIAPKSRLDRITSDRKEFSSAPSSRSRWQARHGRRGLSARRKVRQSGFDLSWSVGRCSAPSGASRKCACRVSIRSQRRSAAWCSLWNGRKG